MKKSRTIRCSPAVESPRHLPLVDLLVDARTELFELAVRSGLKVLETMLEEDRVAVCGPRYAHVADRRAVRGGTVSSEVVLGGRKVAVPRPRVRADGHEVPLPTFQAVWGAVCLGALGPVRPITGRSVDRMRLIRPIVFRRSAIADSRQSKSGARSAGGTKRRSRRRAAWPILDLSWRSRSSTSKSTSTASSVGGHERRMRCRWHPAGRPTPSRGAGRSAAFASREASTAFTHTPRQMSGCGG